MTLTINGKERTFDAATMSVAEVVTACGFPDKGIAVAIGNKVVSRKAWADTMLTDGVTLTVIRAVCGG